MTDYEAVYDKACTKELTAESEGWPSPRDAHKAGLSAVVDAAKKEAWDEGYESGVDDESFTARGSLSDPDAAEHPHYNPYAHDNLAAAHATDLREQSKHYAVKAMNSDDGRDE